MNQIQISILYELIVFVYNVHLHEIVKLRKTAKKSLQLAPHRGVWHAVGTICLLIYTLKMYA
jgi:hypothetical protein